MTVTPHGLGPTRAKVLALLQFAPRPRSISEISETLRLHRNSARFHLDALVEAGYAERSVAGTGLPGRPPQLFSATSDAPPMSSIHLLELTQVLLGQVAALSTDPAGMAEAAGRDWGASTAAHDDGHDNSAESSQISAELSTHLAARGFGTTKGVDGLVFTRCPFREIVPEDRLPLVCAVHQGFLDGFLEGTCLEAGRLDVSPQRCTVTLHLRPPDAQDRDE